MHRTFYVYILRCVDDSYYIGVTNNVDRRFAEHQDGLNAGSYTHDRRPVELVYVERYSFALEAIAREKQLKRWSRRKKEALIAGDVAKLRFEALAHERKTFPPLSPEERRPAVKRSPKEGPGNGSTGSP
ncbi:MAG: GIY-YIG nuclease family protein [Flavobacteriales bacterium]|nr:GIY-YIG nuclease family protein [Flavobacteriales bacterium]